MTGKKIYKFIVIFLIAVWLFSGWPQMLELRIRNQELSVPPEIKIARADTANLLVTACDLGDIADSTCYNAISANGGTSFAFGKSKHIDASIQTLSGVDSVTSATLYYDSWATLSGTWEIYVKDARDGTTICSVSPAPEDGSETNNSTDCSSVSPTQLANGVWFQSNNNDGAKSQDVNLDFVYLYVDYVAVAPDDVTVNAIGSQNSSLAIPSTDQYVGGAFVISEDTSSRNVTNITIAEQGTVNAQNNLSSVRLYYETSSDCSGESFSGLPSPSESPFGSSTTFNGANGVASFSGSVAITTSSEMCVYAVVNIGSGAGDTETLEIQITDPSTDVSVDGGGQVGPSSAVAISGTTTLNMPGVTGTLGKSADSWGGAIPAYMTLDGLSKDDYPYARAKVDTPGSDTFYTNMTWNSGNSRYEGTIYIGSNLCNGCVDPTLGSFSVTVQLDDDAGFSSIDYSDATSGFSTYETRRKSSKGTGTDYTDYNSNWNVDHWNNELRDFVIHAGSGTRTNAAVSIPFHPITASVSNITVSFNGTGVSSGSAESTSDAWWWDSTIHTLYVQRASLTTSEVDVDITFDSDTDLFATRYDRVQTADMGNRLFYNGLFINNQYLSASVYGGGHEGAGEQAETRAHEPTGDNDTSDCMERVAVHLDDTQNCDASGYYTCNIKWKQQEWANYITAESNSSITTENNTDDNASTGWEPQKDYGISTKRTQVFYSGERYIKNTYEITNGDTVSHDIPLVQEREQWLSGDRAANDEGRYQGDTSDVTLETRNSMSGYSCPWMTSYDTGNFNSMGFIFQSDDRADYGIFAVEPFLTNTTGAEWPVVITASHATQTADQTGFEKTWTSVPASETRTFTYWQTHYNGTSWSDISSAMDEDCAELNPTGSFSADIVDAGGNPVASPSVNFASKIFSWANQQATGTFGTTNEKIRVDNGTATASWSLAIAATDGSTALWDSGTYTYDYNGTASAGRLLVDAGGGTVVPEGGCSTTGISKGSAAYFEQGITDSITILSASSSADTGCYWDFTGVDLTQDMSAGQEAGSYSISMTLTAS